MQALRIVFVLLTTATLFGCPMDEVEWEFPACEGQSDCCVGGECWIGTTCRLVTGGEGTCTSGYLGCRCDFAGGGVDDGGLVVLGEDPDDGRRMRYSPPSRMPLRLPPMLSACSDAVDPLTLEVAGHLDIRQRMRPQQPTDRLLVEDSTLHLVDAHVPCFGRFDRVDLAIESGAGTYDRQTGLASMILVGDARVGPMSLPFELVVRGHAADPASPLDLRISALRVGE